MPFGLRDVLAALLVLVGGLGCERKCREAAVIGVANFCVAAEESDEVDFVLVHGFVSVLLNSRVVLGSHPAKPARGPAPKAEALHLRRPPEKFFAELRKQISSGNRNPQGDAIEAEERVAAGRRQTPRSRDRAESGIRNGRRPQDQSRDLIRSPQTSPSQNRASET